MLCSLLVRQLGSEPEALYTDHALMAASTGQLPCPTQRMVCNSHDMLLAQGSIQLRVQGSISQLQEHAAGTCSRVLLPTPCMCRWC